MNSMEKERKLSFTRLCGELKQLLVPKVVMVNTHLSAIRGLEARGLITALHMWRKSTCKLVMNG